ncbi:hypothetical protein MN608_00199 [Microdochium nivale]|nr:hypothetical protein MN608_00199 [Microdochium nivale]
MTARLARSRGMPPLAFLRGPCCVSTFPLVALQSTVRSSTSRAKCRNSYCSAAAPSFVIPHSDDALTRGHRTTIVFNFCPSGTSTHQKLNPPQRGYLKETGA